jgi:hypothetical protein
MIHQPRSIIGAIFVGLGATLLIDLWALFLRRGFDIPSLNYCLLGRWILHLPGGTIVHANITTARPKPHECTMGWLVSESWLERPTPLPALAFGVATTLVPYLIMQPSFGLGVAASRRLIPTRRG